LTLKNGKARTVEVRVSGSTQDLRILQDVLRESAAVKSTGTITLRHESVDATQQQIAGLEFEVESDAHNWGATPDGEEGVWCPHCGDGQGRAGDTCGCCGSIL